MEEPQATEPIMWVAEILRSSTEPLGIMLEPLSLTVRCISNDSAAGRWNAANPDKSINEGDHLVEVNGHRTTQGIARACQNAHGLRIIVEREGEGVVARQLIQDCLCLAYMDEEDEDASTYDVQVPDVEDDGQVASGNSKQSGRAEALAASPYATAKQPRKKSRRPKRPLPPPAPPPAGFRDCLSHPPEDTEVLLPPLPPASAAAPSSPPSFQQSFSPGKVVVPPVPMPEWMIREASMVQAAEQRLHHPQPPQRSPRPPGGAPSAGYGSSSRPPSHLDMYSRPRLEFPYKMRQSSHRPQGDRRLAPLSDMRGQQSAGYITAEFPDVTEDMYRTWRDQMVNHAVSVARSCDMPLGMISKMGTRAI